METTTYKDDSLIERPLKRKRITMACHRCRQKKGKCDGTKPVCGNCHTSRTLCEWPNPEQDGRKHKKSVKSKVEPLEHDELAMDSDNQRRSPYPRSNHTLESPSLRHDAPRYSSMASPPRRGPNDESISAPHPSVHPHPHPHNQSALDILLAAALPGHHNEPHASSSRLPGSGSQSSHDQHSLGTPTLESGRKSVSQSHDPPLVLQYHRAFGPTAIQPGLEQISIAFRAPPPGSRCASPTPPSVSPLLPQPQGPPDPYNLNGLTPFSFEPIHYINPLSAIHNGEAPSPVGNPSMAYLPDSPYDIDSDIPRPSVLQRLLPLFFTRMGSHFPFLTESRVMGNIDHEDPSKRVTAPLLINTICALASRFSDVPIVRSQRDRSPATYGIPFAEKSKQLLVPLLGYPSSNTVAALLFLAYFSFGLNSEGALWTYSGMALRMAVDLGLHQDLACRAVPSSPIQQYEDRLLWWSCFLLDRILAFGTGRPVTVKDKEITTPLPTETEMTAVHATFHEQGTDGSSSQTPSPFPYFVRMFKMYGELAEVINTVETTWLPPVSEPPSRGEQPTSEEAAQQPATHPESSVDLCEVEDAITSVYNSLPESMTFSSENLQAHASKMEGPVFLALHLWYNCIVIFLYRPPLIHPKVNAARASLQDRLAVVNNACQMISSVITSADLVDPFSYLASPFVNQCLFVAASAWVQDYRIRTGRVLLASTAPSEKTTKNVLNSSTNILAQVAMNNFKLCKRALNRQTAFWMGVKWIEAVVEKYASQKRRASLKNALEGVDTFVSGAEMAIFKRLVQRTTGASPSSEFSAEALSALFSAFSHGQDSSVSLSEDDWALAYSFASMTAANDSRYDMNAFA